MLHSTIHSTLFSEKYLYLCTELGVWGQDMHPADHFGYYHGNQLFVARNVVDLFIIPLQ